MQKYSSKDTSINVVNKVYKTIEFRSRTRILDYGGGKYDSNKKYMAEKGCELYVYDKFNRDEEHNKNVLEIMRTTTPDYVVCSNVLNVIMEDEIIDDILRNISKYKNAEVLIAIYEGDGSGKGAETSKGWQRNQKAKDYIPFIERYFNIISCKNKIIKCKAK